MKGQLLVLFFYFNPFKKHFFTNRLPEKLIPYLDPGKDVNGALGSLQGVRLLVATPVYVDRGLLRWIAGRHGALCVLALGGTLVSRTSHGCPFLLPPSLSLSLIL
jgi:hypothetical protein